MPGTRSHIDVAPSASSAIASESGRELFQRAARHALALEEELGAILLPTTGPRTTRAGGGWKTLEDAACACRCRGETVAINLAAR